MPAPTHPKTSYLAPPSSNDPSLGYQARSNIATSTSTESSPTHSPYARNLSHSHSHHVTGLASSMSVANTREYHTSARHQALDEQWSPVARSKSTSRTDASRIYVPPIHAQSANGAQDSIAVPLEATNGDTNFARKSAHKPSEPKKRVFVNVDLVDEFVRLADDATRRNKETMGIIAGKLNQSNEYVVTHLIVPHQTGTHDSCETLDYEELTKEMLSEDLTQLGWIHVHPRFEVFLSSVDMHTQLVPQQQLSEYFAIVWSPIGNPSLGVFNLTDLGLDVLSKCDLGNGFHEHNTDGYLFEDSSHVSLLESGMEATKIVDLRNAHRAR